MQLDTQRGLSPQQTALFAVACGALVANIYYAQALVSAIGPALGLHAGLSGLAVTLTQLGYGAGMILIVTLADVYENRRLILMCVAAAAVSLIAAACAPNAPVFLLASLAIGISSVGVQIIVPLAAHLTPDARRGRVIGNVMGGLLAGIMLSRPFANFVAAGFGWRAVFGSAAVIAIAIGTLLWRGLPERHPRAGFNYVQNLASLWKLLRQHGLLRRRAAYQATVFAGFNLFWTAVPLVLSQAFGFGQREIALFALAGAGGALAAPFAGWLADHGHTRIATIAAMFVLAMSFLLSGWAVGAGALAVLVLSAIALDAATQTNQIVSQRLVYGIDPHARGRINGIYMTAIFLAGALGSLLSGALYYYGGWWATMLAGAAFGIVLVVFALIWRNLDVASS
jgi:predicted MFS family arabinose efflux permease